MVFMTWVLRSKGCNGPSVNWSICYENRQRYFEMTLIELRNVVADHVQTKHGNAEFIRQIRSGEQDDGPFMMGALAVWAKFMEGLQPAPEVLADD